MLGRVFCEGSVNYDDLAIYYASADVFVMPTLEDNWSLVMPEAMACGLPVVCSVYNGCFPDLVEEHKNGWTFDPLQAADTVGVLMRAINAKKHLKCMGHRSKEILLGHTPKTAALAIRDACFIAMEQGNSPRLGERIGR
jgi:glycosyltransferase involved in cell wall biosynthesis